MPFVPKHIYVAGPLTGSPDQPLLSNISNAFAAAHALLDAGHFPFVPHLYYYMDLGHRRPREDWLELDLAHGSLCAIFSSVLKATQKAAISKFLKLAASLSQYSPP